MGSVALHGQRGHCLHRQQERLLHKFILCVLEPDGRHASKKRTSLELSRRIGTGGMPSLAPFRHRRSLVGRHVQGRDRFHCLEVTLCCLEVCVLCPWPLPITYQKSRCAKVKKADAMVTRGGDEFVVCVCARRGGAGGWSHLPWLHPDPSPSSTSGTLGEGVPWTPV